MSDVRSIVASMYPGKTWAQKVSKMSDAQVFAIYKSNQEKLENGKKDSK